MNGVRTKTNCYTIGCTYTEFRNNQSKYFKMVLLDAVMIDETSSSPRLQSIEYSSSSHSHRQFTHTLNN